MSTVKMNGLRPPLTWTLNSAVCRQEATAKVLPPLFIKKIQFAGRNFIKNLDSRCRNLYNDLKWLKTANN
ncbi:hypothetical protein C5O12_05830 [Akkermansia muciniphila]|nr:hypothetical protein C1O40_06220 [Akkermansia muciniphila]QAA62027.1 hypothetical protein C1O59_05845 [Akkermansia muciniphila]QHV21192.1 hypothetical protein C5O12_05830 [Akkermansia muciniphila]QHV27926.1 hypothetical protein C5O14_05850 [Akkermansia muciniphila]